jgi:hypothetical protein
MFKKTSIALGQKLTDKNIGPVIGILTEGFSDRLHRKTSGYYLNIHNYIILNL